MKKVTLDILVTDNETKVLRAVRAHGDRYTRQTMDSVMEHSGIQDSNVFGGVASSLVQKGLARTSKDTVLLTVVGIGVGKSDFTDLDQQPE